MMTMSPLHRLESKRFVTSMIMMGGSRDGSETSRKKGNRENECIEKGTNFEQADNIFKRAAAIHSRQE